MVQSVRRSQFITTYGPGAILEGPDGPKIISTLGLSGLFANHRPGDFEVTDQRLSTALLNDARILRLPSNADLGRPDGYAIYSTGRFPTWSLCVGHGVDGILYRKRSGDNVSCPRCPQAPDSYASWRQAKRQAIRFIKACPVGHLDDVSWDRIIPHNSPDCRPGHLVWRGSGAALRHVQIVCPACGGNVNLGHAYSREWDCSGRFPELGNQQQLGGCDRKAKIIQRGAANLYLPDIKAAVTIPPRSTPIHRILEAHNIQSVLRTNRFNSYGELMAALRVLEQSGLVSGRIVLELGSTNGEAVMLAVNDLLTRQEPRTVEELKLEEFEALQHAAQNGHPRLRSTNRGLVDQFEVIKENVRTIVGPGGQPLRVTPLNRLRVVMVQTGYRRLEAINPLVDRAYEDEQGTRWYPGVELLGEGIFIDIAPPVNGSQTTALSGSVASGWNSAWADPVGWRQNTTLEHADHLNPVFVWWHTFAHRLINALAIDSGYSSASIRERIYVSIDPQTRVASGGILLYTSQPGGDGTLGGLVALVPEFEMVLDAALRDVHTCSNDPLCFEERFDRGKSNGPACYACLLVSETSCEHRNMLLDRALLLENLP